MLQAIVNAAIYGGDKAIAGSRGEGKTRLALYGALYLMIAGLSRFTVVIGKNQTRSANELKTIRERLQQAPKLRADFPEICVPFKAVGGWSSRALMQTVAGLPTNIEIAKDHLIFPRISREQLPDKWPDECLPVSSGQIMASVGIDGPIRGMNYYDRRPELALLDDIEDRKAAQSDELIAKNKEIIEQDVSGLGAGGKRVSRVMLCTTQNRKCIAFTYTDRDQQPSWNGQRFRKMIKPPSRMDLVDQYVELRRNRAKDDPDARAAFRFWKENQDEIEHDCVVSNVFSYEKRYHADGEPLELSAVQAYYNRVADFGKKAVATEDDNDPPAETGPMSNGLTAELVASRISGLAKYQLPANTEALTAAIDLGKYYCHWVVTAWWRGFGGCVVDYGYAKVLGTDDTLNNVASEPHIYHALLNWREELLAKKYVDATGTERKIGFVLVDSGAFTNAAYEFARQVGGVFHASKGQSPYHIKRDSSTELIAGTNQHAVKMRSQGLWLYHLNTDYWKRFVHERFLTPTFDENNMLRRGSLSIYESSHGNKHAMFSQHIVAERLMSEFKEGKGTREYWDKVGEDNHWLDALYMAAAGGEAVGIKLLGDSEVELQASPSDGKPKKSSKPHGSSRFKQRPGGWIQGIRKR